MEILLAILFHFLLRPLVAIARYPCLNDGEPVLLGQSGNEFRCECPAGFFGPFCEYQDTSQGESSKSKGVIPLLTSSTGSAQGWEVTFVNLLLCVFFLLLLPSLVIYAMRTLYLFLKRCHGHYSNSINNGTRQTAPIGPAAAVGGHPSARPTTPPPHYWASNHPPSLMIGHNSAQWLANPANDRRQLLLAPQTASSSCRRGPLQQRRRRSESPPITEVTVQLPASICRPLHGTRSAGPLLHPTQSLTLNEFHELLLSIQQEMVTQQQQQQERTATGECQQQPAAAADCCENQQQELAAPPDYESAIRSSPPSATHLH